MSEIESDHEDHEEASLDPFANDKSGDEMGDSSSNDEDGAAERDCLSIENFLGNQEVNMRCSRVIFGRC